MYDGGLSCPPLPTEVNEEMRTALRARTNTTIEFKRGDSDNYISITDHGDKQQIITFKLGVPFTFDEEGFEVKVGAVGWRMGEREVTRKSAEQSLLPW